MLAFQAPPLPRQGQTVMSVKTKKLLPWQESNLRMPSEPKSDVPPLHHTAMRLSELHGKFMANVTQVWQSQNAQSRKSLLTTLQKYNKVFTMQTFGEKKFTSCHFLPKERDMP